VPQLPGAGSALTRRDGRCRVGTDPAARRHARLTASAGAALRLRRIWPAARP